LELRSATYDDAQKLAREWQHYSKVSPGCNSNSCKITITLSDPRAYPRLLSWFFQPPWLARLVLRTGVRPAGITGEIKVRNGKVWGKHFGIEVYVRDLGRPNGWPLTLMADTSTVYHFAAYGEIDPQLRIHPDYVIGRPGGCDGPCVLAYARFTPYADPKDVRRLMQINLSCLTRWVPCQTEADILPQPWAQHEGEEPAIVRAYHQHSCEAADAALLGRDAENAAIIRIEAIEKLPETDAYLKLRARMIRALKPAKSWPEGSSAEFRVDPRSLFSPSLKLQPNMQVILLFGTQPAIEAKNCGILRLDADNLRRVQKGVDEDFSPDDPDR
jgi:hypothetical protein